MSLFPKVNNKHCETSRIDPKDPFFVINYYNATYFNQCNIKHCETSRVLSFTLNANLGKSEGKDMTNIDHLCKENHELLAIPVLNCITLTTCNIFLIM